MSEQVFLSIITVNFNNAVGLKKTVQSVLGQDFKNWEYLIIDGGSTDGSKEIIEANAASLSHWVSEPDEGIYHAMNKGIAKAEGEYLLFLNSGDFLADTTALSRFIGHQGFTGDIIYGDYLFAEGSKKYPDELYPAYFMKTSLPHQSTLFKASVFDKLGSYDLQFPMGADRAFYIKAHLADNIKFAHVPVFLTHFDLSGISNDPEWKSRKLSEDERLLKHCYGGMYHEMKAEIEQELQESRVPKYSVKGILKRLKKRLHDL